MRPILIMKGKNDLKRAERAQYSPVDVLMQEKPVNDNTLMVSHVLWYRRQTPSHQRAFVLDSARQHIIKSGLQAMNDGMDFHTSVEEGTTCCCQSADLYCFWLWKFFYRDELVTADAQCTEPRFTAPERRVLSTQIVAKAWNS